MEQITALFLGPQGCGKGTQINLLKSFLKEKDPHRPIVHLEMGAELRAFGTEGGYTQDLIDASLKRGELQAAFITTYVMARFFIKHVTGNEHVIIDCFPRSLEQFSDFNSMMELYQRKNPFVFWIEISDETALKRLLARGRNDDTEESIRNRLSWSRKQVTEALQKFRSMPESRIVEIDGEREIEAVHRDIMHAIFGEK